MLLYTLSKSQINKLDRDRRMEPALNSACEVSLVNFLLSVPNADILPPQTASGWVKPTVSVYHLIYGLGWHASIYIHFR